MSAVTETYSEQLIRARQFIEQHDRFLVVSHVQPDGDAISSTSAVGYLLKRLDKTFTMVNEDRIPGKFAYLWGSGQIFTVDELESSAPFDCVIAVDCADYSRVGKAERLFSDQVKILNIDHHPTNDFYGAENLIKEDAAATAEILYDLVNEFKLPWDTEMAVSIYTGILTDTGGFRYANTSPKVMKIASELLTYGVNAHQMAENLLEKCTLSHIQLLRKALSTLSFACGNKISWVSVSAEDIERYSATNEDLEGLVNYPRNIEGVEVGVLFKELGEEEVKISLRSTGNVDVAEIAKTFRGGGHVRAAGATIRKKMEETIPLVIDKIRQVLS